LSRPQRVLFRLRQRCGVAAADAARRGARYRRRPVADERAVVGRVRVRAEPGPRGVGGPGVLLRGAGAGRLRLVSNAILADTDDRSLRRGAALWPGLRRGRPAAAT